jgi:rubredoxin
MNGKKEEQMDRWKCRLCGYVYDPANGDSVSNIAPNTSFESLPDDWVCPICGATKDQFEKLE